MNSINKMDCNSDFFTLYKLNDSCYAAIEKEGARTGSNAGFVDIDGMVIVFDTFLSLGAAKDLLDCIKEITGGVPSYVVNSHEHSDHFVGNQVFKEFVSYIVSTHQTRSAVNKFQETLDRVAELPEDWVENRLLEIQNEEDETKKKSR